MGREQSTEGGEDPLDFPHLHSSIFLHNAALKKKIPYDFYSLTH